jgi:XrtJ-associated TM-motif-TM protein
MKPLYRVLLVLTVLLIALPLYAQGGCDDSPEAPTVVLAMVAVAGGCLPLARARFGSRRRNK